MTRNNSSFRSCHGAPSRTMSTLALDAAARRPHIRVGLHFLLPLLLLHLGEPISAAPSDLKMALVKKSDTNNGDNKSLSPQIWIPAVVVVLFLLMIFTLLWTRKSMLNRIRQLSLSHDQVRQSPVSTSRSRSLTASQLFGRNRAGANDAAAAGNGTTDAGTITNANARRTRRTPSQISTASLPVYMKEPGEHELVIFRGPVDMEDAMPLTGSQSPLATPGTTTLSTLQSINREQNRPLMPVVLNDIARDREAESPRSSMDSVRVPLSPASRENNASSNDRARESGAESSSMTMPHRGVYTPMPLLPLVDQSGGESMLNLNDGEADEDAEGREGPDASTLELMPKTRIANGSNTNIIGSTSLPPTAEASESRRSSIRNSIRNSLRLSGSIRDSRGPAPPYFEVVGGSNMDDNGSTIESADGGRVSPPGLNIRTSMSGSQASANRNSMSMSPMSPSLITPTTAGGVNGTSAFSHQSSNHNTTESITDANTAANSRRRTGFRSFFSTLSRPPAAAISVPGINQSRHSGISSHSRHRTTQSGGSGSTLGTIGSSSNSGSHSVLNLSRTRSNNTLISNASRADLTNGNASTTRLPLSSPSSLSVNSISAPLTHTVVRTEFRYPRGGPTPEQIRLISSRETLGRFGMPYGEDAVRHHASFSNLGGLDPPPEFESPTHEHPPDGVLTAGRTESPQNWEVSGLPPVSEPSPVLTSAVISTMSNEDARRHSGMPTSPSTVEESQTVDSNNTSAYKNMNTNVANRLSTSTPSLSGMPSLIPAVHVVEPSSSSITTDS